MAHIDEMSKDPVLLEQQFRDPAYGAKFLRNVPLFQKFTDEEFKSLYALGNLVKLKPKANAVIEGEPSRGLYLLLYGTVSVYKTDQTTGSLHRLAMLEEGSYFGELSLFDDAPRSATVVAENQCYLFYLDASKFNQFLEQIGNEIKVRFFQTCAETMVRRFRTLNQDYIVSQQLLWKHALRRSEEVAAK